MQLRTKTFDRVKDKKIHLFGCRIILLTDQNDTIEASELLEEGKIASEKRKKKKKQLLLCGCASGEDAMETRRPLHPLLLFSSPWLLLLLLLVVQGVSSLQFTREDFPDGFTFGAGTAAFQVS